MNEISYNKQALKSFILFLKVLELLKKASSDWNKQMDFFS